MTTKFDILVMKDYARRQGLAEGKAEGEEKAKLEIAKKLLAAGMDAAAVATVTGLEPGVVATL